MKRMVDTQEAAKILRTTDRTIRRWFEAGKIPGQIMEAPKGGGNKGTKLMVEIDEPNADCGLRNAESKGKDEILRSAQDDNTKRYKVNRGEPGKNIITPFKDGEPIWIPGQARNDKINIASAASFCVEAPEAPVVPCPPGDPGTEGVYGNAECGLRNAEENNMEPNPANRGITVTGLQKYSPGMIEEGAQIGDREAGDGKTNPDLAHQNLPTIYNDKATGQRPVPPACQRIGNLRFALIEQFNQELNRNHRPKTEIIKQFLDLYNSGLLLPEIYDTLGSVSRATLYMWLAANRDYGIDGLVPSYGGGGTSKVIQGEKDFLLRFLLRQNRPKISDGIRECKRYLGEYSISSPTTLRRFVNDFKIQFHDVWTLDREGEKAWNDKDAPYQDRDPMLLSVGEVLVADGHKLNIDAIDPVTGKKKRPTLVLFWDWKSSYPVGWEIMFSENIQCISTALRNALLTLGKIPPHIYIDNGKAFVAKVFTKKIRMQETEIPGMLARLGITYHRSLKYHAQSKPVERFFRVLNDRFERRQPPYRGSSISDKPAYLLPNEPRAKALHDPRVFTTQEISQMLLHWREEFVDEPLPKRDGLTSRQMFDEGKGAGLDPKALCFLMMVAEIRAAQRNRIRFAGIDWEGPCLYGYKGKVIIRYSLGDFSRIYVFNMQDKFMGIATQADKANPIRDWQAAKKIINDRRLYKRQTKKLSDFIREKPFVLEGGRSPDLIDYIEGEESKNAPKLLPFPIKQVPDEPVIEANENDPPRFSRGYDRYEYLLAEHGNRVLSELEKIFIRDYEDGIICPGEWKGIYGSQGWEKKGIQWTETGDSVEEGVEAK